MLGKMIVVLVSGKAGTGKDEVSKMLKDYYTSMGLKGDVFKFARGVKNVALAMGWDGQKDARGRELLQNVGRMGRKYDIDVWAKRAAEDIMTSVDVPDFAIISDWRFINESDYFKNNFPIGNVFKVRIEAPERESLKGSPLYYDESETSLPSGVCDLYDFVIYNQFSLTDLRAIVNEFGKEIYNRMEKWE